VTILFFTSHQRRLTAENQIRDQSDQLAKSEARWRTASETFNDGIWEFDLHNRRFSASQRWLQLLGYSSHELTDIYHNWQEFIHPEDWAIVSKAWSLHLENKTDKMMCDVRIRHKDRTYRTFNFRGRIEFDDTGKPQRVIGSHTDITAQKSIEQQLVASESGYRNTVDHLPVVVFHINRESQWTFLNHAWVNLTGIPISESLGTTFTNQIHPDDRSMVMRWFADLKTGRSNQVLGELRILNRQRIYRWIDFSAHVLPSYPERIVGSLTDITRIKLADLSTHASEEKLRSLFERSPIGISLSRLDGTLLLVNAAFVSITGRSSEECTQLTHSDLLPVDAHTFENELIRQLHTSGRFGAFDTSYRQKDG
jgi:PAS domain S-box-containing protein